ncbi:MAG TPA: hypothetical protein VEI57_05645 [Nitrospirota bacterium]|nr:hypothetical protein [Nitrospirota bacterium]
MALRDLLFSYTLVVNTMEGKQEINNGEQTMAPRPLSRVIKKWYSMHRVTLYERPISGAFASVPANAITNGNGKHLLCQPMAFSFVLPV